MLMHLYLFLYFILFNSFSYSFIFKHLFRKNIHINNAKYTVFHNKEKKKFKYNNINNYFYDNKYLINKKVINIYPAGIKGFYEMGLCTFIKENNNLENIVFSGASAGAWNALLLAYKGDVLEFKKIIFDIDFKSIKSIFEIQQIIKRKILNHFTSDDFNLKQIFVGLTVLDFFKFKTSNISNNPPAAPTSVQPVATEQTDVFKAYSRRYCIGAAVALPMFATPIRRRFGMVCRRLTNVVSSSPVADVAPISEPSSFLH